MQTHEEPQAVLNTLAANFGTSIESLWTILMRQVWVSVVGDWLFTLVIILITGALAWTSRWIFRDDEHGPWEVPLFGAIVMGVIAFIVLCITVYSTTVAILNPEWAALELILNKLGSA